MMEIVWMVLGGLLLVVGFLGCFLPALPGPPLAFLALLVQQLRADGPFTTRFLLVWLAVAVVVTALDYWIPIYSTKKLGGTRAGMWGATVGLLVGLFIGPWGIIIGPFLGALVAELMANQTSEVAVKSALGSLVGFLFGTVLKLAVTVAMGWYLIASFFA
jgi:uncharacterized protein YqgC (DUF456 family)